MTADAGQLPDITRPDAGLVMVGEWSVATPERRIASAEATMAGWEHVPWPEGLLSHNCFVSTDDSTVLQYAQWTSDEARDEFWRTDPPERLRAIDAAVSGIERHGGLPYRLYRSSVADGPARVPGCIVVITFETDGPEAQRQLIDAVFDTADSDPHPGLIAAHFHLGTDGTRALNYAEWTDETAHREFVEGTTETRRAQISNVPGVRGLGFKRYTIWQTRSQPRQSG